jgi:hypothetical protein
MPRFVITVCDTPEGDARVEFSHDAPLGGPDAVMTSAQVLAIAMLEAAAGRHRLRAKPRPA